MEIPLIFEEKAMDTTATSKHNTASDADHDSSLNRYSHHTGSPTNYSPIECLSPQKLKK
jgi:hypothetical protein